MRYSFLCLLLLLSCDQKIPHAQAASQQRMPVLNTSGTHIATRFNPPAGYTRQPTENKSYAAFLRKLPLKPDGAKVHYFDGRVKANPGIYAAVVDLEIGKKDLQQCADAVMCLRATFLYEQGRKQEIAFRFTNGFQADFKHWMEGHRIVVSGNHCRWSKSAAPASDYRTLRTYLEFVYNYAGSLSLSKELCSVPYKEMQPGDVLIVGGSPGHAVTVMDMAVNRAGKKVFMLSQSYMPAQDIQVLENPSNLDISPWYELDAPGEIVTTPQWEFTKGQLRRFP